MIDGVNGMWRRFAIIVVCLCGACTAPSKDLDVSGGALRSFCVELAAAWAEKYGDCFDAETAYFERVLGQSCEDLVPRWAGRGLRVIEHEIDECIEAVTRSTCPEAATGVHPARCAGLLVGSVPLGGSCATQACAPGGVCVNRSSNTACEYVCVEGLRGFGLGSECDPFSGVAACEAGQECILRHWGYEGFECFAALGGACSQSGDCEGSVALEYCDLVAGACRPVHQEHDACVANRECLSGHCMGVSGGATCSPAAIGSDCEGRRCFMGMARCDASSRRCVEFRVRGEGCETTQDCWKGLVCELGVCRSGGGPGEPCVEDRECRSSTCLGGDVGCFDDVDWCGPQGAR